MNKKALIEGVKWNSFAVLASKVSVPVLAVITARIIGVEDFGVYSLALAFYAVLMVLTRLQLTEYIVYKQVPQEQCASYYTVSVVFSASMCFLFALAAPFVAAFFDMPALTPVLQCICATVVLFSMQEYRIASARRDLKFRKLAIITSVVLLVDATSALVLAVLGFSYWSFVLSKPLSLIIGLGVWEFSYRYSFKIPRLSKMVEAVKYSYPLAINGGTGWIQTQFDNVCVGKAFSASILGAYNIAFRIAVLPQAIFGEVFTKVLFPVFSSSCSDQSKYSTYLRLTKLCAIIFLPLSVFVSFSSDILIKIVLGNEWMIAAPYLAILIWFGTLGIFGGISVPVFNSMGLTKQFMHYRLIRIGFTIPAIVVGALISPVAVAVAHVLTIVFALPLLYYYLCSNTELKLQSILSSFREGLVASAVLAVILGLLRGFIPEVGLVVTFLMLSILSVIVVTITGWHDFKALFQQYKGIKHEAT
ncbi:MAG: oligosaccharide flippase family protein [Planctomycetota bacterium]|nr:oligosaccharide flippase family protein [Planctomycetota bacterium]